MTSTPQTSAALDSLLAISWFIASLLDWRSSNWSFPAADLMTEIAVFSIARSISLILYTDLPASRTLKNTVDTSSTSTLSSVITDIWNRGNCLSSISTLKATLSMKGTIIDSPDSRILVNLPNRSTTKTFDCGTTFMPK